MPSLLRRPLPPVKKPEQTRNGADDDIMGSSGPLGELVQDLNEVFDKALSEIYDHALENSSYADSSRESERESSRESEYPEATVEYNGKKFPSSPKTAFAQKMQKQQTLSRSRTMDSVPSGTPLVQPYHTRGPAPLTVTHGIKQPPQVSLAYLHAMTEFENEQHSGAPPPSRREDPRRVSHDFRAETFLQPVPRESRVQRSALKKSVLSRHNYKKLTTLFADAAFRTNQNHVHQIHMQGEEIDPVVARIPYRQLLLEMAAILKEEASTMRHNMQSAHKAYNKFISTATQAAHIVDRTPQRFEWLESSEEVYQYATARLFDDVERSDSPVEKVPENALITAAELAVLDAVVCGGQALSLKGHFLSSLPDLAPLVNTLKYLNLSFNELKELPEVITQLRHLEVLKARSNPIKRIPEALGTSLGNLKCLVLGFCNISVVPLSLYQLTCLEILDLRYNVITRLENDVQNFSSLKELNVEGNQLTSLPAGLLRVRTLRSLNVRNNFMHPLLWHDLTKHNQLQSLRDLCCVMFSRCNFDASSSRIKPNIRNILQPEGTCDCCGGPLYGDGIKVVRPSKSICGVPNIPFLFTSCSPYCVSDFNRNDPKTVRYIYNSHQ